MNIGIIGSRRRNEKSDMKVVLEAFMNVLDRYADHVGGNNFQIISGGCPKGGDLFAEMIAETMDHPIRIFHADWKRGRHAGFLRNSDIAQHSDILIACVASDRTGGTEDTIKKFLKKLAMTEEHVVTAGWLILV